MADTTDTPVLDLLAAMTADSIEASTLDAETLLLVRIAALVAVDAAPASYLMNLGAAQELDLDMEKVRGVLDCGGPDRRHRAGRLRARQDDAGARTGAGAGRGGRGRRLEVGGPGARTPASARRSRAPGATVKFEAADATRPCWVWSWSDGKLRPGRRPRSVSPKEVDDERRGAEDGGQAEPAAQGRAPQR